MSGRITILFAISPARLVCRVLDDAGSDRRGQLLASPRALIPVMLLLEQRYDADTTPADRWGLRHDSRYRCHGCEARARDRSHASGRVQLSAGVVLRTPRLLSQHGRACLAAHPGWSGLLSPNGAAEGAPPRVSVRQPRLKPGPLTSLVGKCEGRVTWGHLRRQFRRDSILVPWSILANLRCRCGGSCRDARRSLHLVSGVQHCAAVSSAPSISRSHRHDGSY